MVVKINSKKVIKMFKNKQAALIHGCRGLRKNITNKYKNTFDL